MGTLIRNYAQHAVVPKAVPGAILIALSGVGMMIYGVLQYIRTFAGWIEFGLTPAIIGGTPEQIQAFSPRLFDYISHIQLAASGFMIAFGFMVVGLAWFGIRSGQQWALWTAVGGHLVAYISALPFHFVYGIDTLGHLGPVYLDAAFLVVGTILSYNALK